MLPWFCLDCGVKALQCSPQPEHSALPHEHSGLLAKETEGEGAWLLPQHRFGMWPGHAPGAWMEGSISKSHSSDTPRTPRPVKWAPGLSSEVRSSHYLSEALRGLFN